MQAIASTLHPKATATLLPPARTAKRGPRQWLRILSPLALLALWQMASQTGLIPNRTLAAPRQVFASFWQLTADGCLRESIAGSEPDPSAARSAISSVALA